jgi:hypothetical protein
MLAVSSPSAVTGRKTIAKARMKSAKCFKGHTNQPEHCYNGIWHLREVSPLQLYQCFLTCFTEASFEASLRVSHVQLLVVTCMITPSLLPRVQPACGCLRGVGIKIPLLSHFCDSTNTTELNTL